ncbi:MAG TPA: methyltransferase domain-containing protein [Nevskia sp.]|jgi:ubiquinone/menaquinone biosynthesis C-methylase UbiE|nr:methyltransferase domain-containing protein [Nevskia sp.]
MNTALPTRRPHAVLDLPSRRLKAQKIERLLELEPADKPIRMLEIGCGTGGISHYFGTHPDLDCEVDAVDVIDQRKISSGYRFSLVSGCKLPFPDASFDVVISNHVIEHVGGADQQREHLAEIHRVMKPDGRGYLAVPNRWQLVEPHYRLAFLSWLPRHWRTPYLKLLRRGDFYDCEPLTVTQIEELLEKAGFGFYNACAAATRLTFELECPGDFKTYLVQRMPIAVLHAVGRAIPTLIYVFRPE